MFAFESVDSFPQDERVRKYLVYHIDEGPSIIPMQTPNHHSFIAVGEDFLDQRYALICGKGTGNQASQRWDTPAREKFVRPTDLWFLRS